MADPKTTLAHSSASDESNAVLVRHLNNRKYALQDLILKHRLIGNPVQVGKLQARLNEIDNVLFSVSELA